MTFTLNHIEKQMNKRTKQMVWKKMNKAGDWRVITSKSQLLVCDFYEATNGTFDNLEHQDPALIAAFAKMRKNEDVILTTEYEEACAKDTTLISEFMQFMGKWGAWHGETSCSEEEVMDELYCVQKDNVLEGLEEVFGKGVTLEAAYGADDGLSVFTEMFWKAVDEKGTDVIHEFMNTEFEYLLDQYQVLVDHYCHFSILREDACRRLNENGYLPLIAL